MSGPNNPITVAHLYFQDSFGLTLGQSMIVSILGFLLWVATVTLAFLLHFDESVYSGDKKNFYAVVIGLTIATMGTVMIDYAMNKKNWVTSITIALGTTATLFSVGLWAIDQQKTYSTALVVVQACANSIQLGAIFNQNRMPQKVKETAVAPKTTTFMFK